MPRLGDMLWFDLNDASHVSQYVWRCMARIRSLAFDGLIVCPTSSGVLESDALDQLAAWCAQATGRRRLHFACGIPTLAAAVRAAGWAHADWSCPLRHAIYAADKVRAYLDPLLATARRRDRRLYVPSEFIKWDAGIYGDNATRDWWLGESADGFRRFVQSCAPARTYLYGPAPEQSLLNGLPWEDPDRAEVVEAHLRAVAGLPHAYPITLGRYTPQHAAGSTLVSDEQDVEALLRLGFARHRLLRGRRIGPGLWPIEQLLYEDTFDVPVACYAGSADMLPATLGVNP